jgi:hypothetical protein
MRIAPKNLRAQELLQFELRESRHRFSTGAMFELQRLIERANVELSDVNASDRAQEARVNLRRLIFEASQESRVRRDANRRRHGTGRPMISRADILDALKKLCPIWPFCGKQNE